MLKIIGFIALILALMWAYGNFQVKTIDICVSNQETILPVTCQTQEDCVMYLTSAYTAGYPRTELFTGILSETTACKDGFCNLKSFDFKDNRKESKTCMIDENKLSYAVTVEDLVAISKER